MAFDPGYLDPSVVDPGALDTWIVVPEVVGTYVLDLVMLWAVYPGMLDPREVNLGSPVSDIGMSNPSPLKEHVLADESYEYPRQSSSPWISRLYHVI